MTPRSRRFWLPVAAGMSALTCWAWASSAEPQLAPSSDAYRAAQQWNDRPSMRAHHVLFSLIGVPYYPPPENAQCCESLPEHEDEFRQIQYNVPRHYIAWMDNWNGGPQTLVRFRITFPGFAPLTETTKPCLAVAPGYQSPGCFAVNFIIRRGSSSDPPEEVMFNNGRSLFHNQQPLPGPFGFQLYETGPANARIDTYLKKTAQHTLFIQCFSSRTCTSQSRLATGNILELHLYFEQLKDAEQIDEGLRELVQSWVKRDE